MDEHFIAYVLNLESRLKAGELIQLEELKLVDSKGESIIIYAAKLALMVVLKKAIQVVDVNTKDCKGKTALYWAVFKRNIKLTRFLIDNGAALTDDNGVSELEVVVYNGHIELLKLFIEKSSIFNIKTDDWCNALRLASKLNHVEIVRSLVDNGVVETEEEGKTLLMEAVRQEDIELLKLCIEKSSILNIKTEDWCNALRLASKLNHVEIVRLLVDNGVDINSTNDKGETSLMIAAHIGNIETVNLLIQKSADLNVKTKKGYTALYFAVLNNQIEIERILRRNGAWVNDLVIPDDMSIKELQRQEKKAILSTEPLKPLTNNNLLPTPAMLVESRMYSKPSLELKKRFSGKFEKTYQEGVILRPLIEVMGLSALGLHSTTKDKYFKAIVSDDDFINKIKVGWKQNTVSGFYTGKNTIFINHSRHFYLVEALGTIFHESTHFVLRTVFNNSGNPYFEHDMEARLKFEKIFTNTSIKIKSMIRDNKNADYIYNTLNSIFNDYDQDEYAIELAVKIPEIMVTVGIQAAYRWFKDNIPELLDFYENEINPHLVNYLNSHEAGKHMKLCPTKPLSVIPTSNVFTHLESGLEMEDVKKWGAYIDLHLRELLEEYSKKGNIKILEILLLNRKYIPNDILLNSLQIAIENGQLEASNILWSFYRDSKSLIISNFYTLKDIILLSYFMGNPLAMPMLDYFEDHELDHLGIEDKKINTRLDLLERIEEAKTLDNVYALYQDLNSPRLRFLQQEQGMLFGALGKYGHTWTWCKIVSTLKEKCLEICIR